MQRDQQRVAAENHGHRLGLVARSLLLESDCRLGNLLCHARIEVLHGRRPSTAAYGQERKKADVAEHQEVFDHVGLLTNEPPGTAGLLSI